MNKEAQGMTPDPLADARLAARLKTAADYDAPEKDERDADQIAADIERVRLELAATVNDLAARANPTVLQEQAKAKLAGFADLGKQRLRETQDGVANGDPKTLKNVGIAVAVFVGMLILRKLRK